MVEFKDHIEPALFKSIVEGAVEARTESNASKPIRSLNSPSSFESRAHTVGWKIVGSLGSSLNNPALIEHVPMSIIKIF